MFGSTKLCQASQLSQPPLAGHPSTSSLCDLDRGLGLVDSQVQCPLDGCDARVVAKDVQELERIARTLRSLRLRLSSRDLCAPVCSLVCPCLRARGLVVVALIAV